jgi:hypothetical protein
MARERSNSSGSLWFIPSLIIIHVSIKKVAKGIGVQQNPFLSSLDSCTEFALSGTWE